MKNISNTSKILIASIFLVILVYCIYGLLFWTIKGENEKVSILSNEAKIDLQKDESLRATKVSLSNNKDSIENIDSHFLAPDGVVGFIEGLESLGREAGVSISVASVTVEADSKNKNDFKETLRLRVITTGSWSNTYYFISLLENLPLSAEIKNATLSLPGASDKLAFTGASVSSRKPAAEEKWKGEIELTVRKLK